MHAVWCAVPQQWDAHEMGDNRRWFVLESVRELAQVLAGAGIPLTVLDAGDFAGSAVGVVGVVRHPQAFVATTLRADDAQPVQPALPAHAAGDRALQPRGAGAA